MHKPQRTVPQDRPTILLIEHEPTLREALADALQEEGFAVVQAGEVHDAVPRARACEPDLIVVDPRPEASVARVLDRLRSDAATRGRPLIVIRRAAVRPGADPSDRVDALLPGPVDLEVLLEHVWRVVNTRVLGAVGARGHGS